MTISKVYKYIFVCNPKTGSTTVEKYLRKWDATAFHNVIPTPGMDGVQIGSLNGHTPTRKIKELMGERFNDFKVFTFVRSPYEKAVSTYFFYRRKENEARKGLARKRQLQVKINSWLAEGLPFTIWSLIKTVKPNEGYVSGTDGTALVNFIGQTANLNEHLIEISQHLGIEIPADESIRKINASEHDSNYDKYFSKGLHKWLFDLKYRKEIAFYNRVSERGVLYDWKGQKII